MTISTEELQKLLDAPFDERGAFMDIGELRAEVKAMPPHIRPIGNQLQELVEMAMQDKIRSESIKRDLAAEVIRLRARVEAADKLAEAVNAMRRRAASTRGDQAYRELPAFVLNASGKALAAWEATK